MTTLPMNRILIVALLICLLPLTAVSAQTTAACASQAIVQPGDTLSTIAGRTLGNPLAYSQIVAATNANAALDASYATIANANVLAVGWKLCIPGRSSAPAAAAPQPETAPAADNASGLAELELALAALPPADEHPLVIAQMRQQPYPGSEIVIEQVLNSGVNYSRYLASYLSEGNKIYALLTVPQGVAPASGWPVVIFNHGYIPPTQYRTTERYVAYVDGFARSGYIVFRSDYRGHGSSEGEASGGYGSPAYTVDVLNAVAAIKEYAAADPERIGMWGHSMGGHITLRAMVVTGDIQAGVIWAGVVASYPDLIERWRRSSSFTPPRSLPTGARRWRDLLSAAYGAPAENPAFWASISANSFLAELSGPIQLHHGDADTSVPVEFSTTLADQIRAVDGVVESYVYPGDNHNLSAYFTQAMNRSIAFFDKYVKGAG